MHCYHSRVGRPRNIAIAGAGIGGLAAALFLARAGLRVSLLEQSEQLVESGAGIQLGPNALRIVKALGLTDAVTRHACQPQAIAIRSAATGAGISRVLLGSAVQQRYGEAEPGIAII